jgi:spore coat protein U-like protein
MRKFILLLAGGLLATIPPSAAGAATAGGTLPVSATVVKGCSVTTTPLTFGDYDPSAGANVDKTADLKVLCTTGTSFQVGLNAGMTGASVGARKMTNGGVALNYGLYQDLSRQTNWGNTPGTDTPTAVTATATTATLTVYGRIPSGQNVLAGAYDDTVSVTVTY